MSQRYCFFLFITEFCIKMFLQKNKLNVILQFQTTKLEEKKMTKNLFPETFELDLKKGVTTFGARL